MNPISEQAKEKANVILASISPKKIYLGGVYQDVSDFDAQRYLISVAKKFNIQFKDNPLLAHGTRSAERLCQILIDQKLRHDHWRTYGLLDQRHKQIDEGGYYDAGWGLFIVRKQNYDASKAKVDFLTPIEIPLDNLEAILLPKEIKELVKKTFPLIACDKIKEYMEFAKEINPS